MVVRLLSLATVLFCSITQTQNILKTAITFILSQQAIYYSAETSSRSNAKILISKISCVSKVKCVYWLQLAGPNNILPNTDFKKSTGVELWTQALNFDAVTHSGIHLPAHVRLPSANKTASYNTLQALCNLHFCCWPMVNHLI